MTQTSAALLRLRLRTELRKARIAAGLTQRQVAEKMEWSPSKLIRIEAGEVGISINDLRPLAAAYNISDRRKVEELLTMARGSRRMPFSEYRDLFSKDFMQFLALESAASINRQFGSLAIPGLLQTEEYMRAVFSSYNKDLPEELIERYVEARLARQEVLEEAQGCEFFFILDESVVRRAAGGRGVMRAQLERLADLATRPNINLLILPFSVGAHPGILGPFTLFEFRDEAMEDALFLEDSRGITTAATDPVEARQYLERFWELEDLSLKEGVEVVLRRLAERIAEGGDDLEALLQPESS
ncbi:MULTISPECIES: helix-turn-helix transcriptional regulator [unclassified Streptomyces]|uniref:helix-turn-helix domain-containing protein n=1 Tax=unclassified Streptomyces TaxID=2593676 RepID=UPI000DB933C5|nr:MULTISPECIES: helix-turn-helix transcriptional regulator [unclassified Streptomyces]MYT73110.1 helix-turn-helix domain-containing protein [Streptomyces sp. SID8367]RAJ73571.1 helix-turn-helix protein [Streptomyces sp. PsTaAH-137]